jgi:DNA-binding CsgD family transcriptional regulator
LLRCLGEQAARTGKVTRAPPGSGRYGGIHRYDAIRQNEADLAQQLQRIGRILVEVDHQHVGRRFTERRDADAVVHRDGPPGRIGDDGEKQCEIARGDGNAACEGHKRNAFTESSLRRRRPAGNLLTQAYHRFGKLTIVKKRDTEAPGAESEPIVLVDYVPETDPAHAIIAEILRVVPTSRWAFARLRGGGELAGLLLDSKGDGGELASLKTEFSRQRATAKTGSRIAATLGSLGDFASGITLLFADARANFGILTLLRTKELGPFTSSEISMLTLALDGTSERLSALRLNEGAAPRSPGKAAAPPARRKNEEPEGGAFYVLDSDLEIVLTWTGEEQRRIALTGLHTRLANRLPLILEETVRDLIAGWKTDPASHNEGIAHPVPFLVVRTQPMSGPEGLFIGVRIDRFQAPQSLAGPAARFHISPRELQVLALLLDGAKLDEIAEKLHITTSTVQDHVKNMVEKTGTRNRTGLIARVLGWERPPQSDSPI